MAQTVTPGPQARIPFYTLPGIQHTLGPTGGTGQGGMTADVATGRILSLSQHLAWAYNLTTLMPQENLGQPVSASVTAGNLFNFVQDAPAQGTGLGATIGNWYNVLSTAKGFSNGNGSNGNTGWSLSKVMNITDNAYTSGIHQTISANLIEGKLGDGAGLYIYCYNGGGGQETSGEGHTCIRTNGGNLASNVYAGLFNGTGGTSLSHITTTPQAGFPIANGWMIDSTASPLVTGAITGIDSNFIATVSPANLSPPSGQGTMVDTFNTDGTGDPKLFPSVEGTMHTWYGSDNFREIHVWNNNTCL